MKRKLTITLVGAGMLAAATPALSEEPAPELPPTYDPARSFAPLVKAITPAVVSIEVEGVASGPGFSELPPELRFSRVLYRKLPGEFQMPHVGIVP